MKKKPRDLDHYANYIKARAYSYNTKKKYKSFKKFKEFSLLKGWYIINISQFDKTLTKDQNLLIIKTDDSYFKEYYDKFQYLYSSKEYYVFYKEYYSKREVGRKITKAKANTIKSRDNNKCLICETTENLTVDHIYPYSKTKDSSYYNLATLCCRCNTEKANTLFISNLLTDMVIDNVKTTNKTILNLKETRKSKIKKKVEFIENLYFVLFS